MAGASCCHPQLSSWREHSCPPVQAPSGANYRLRLKLRASSAVSLSVQLQLRQTGAPYITYGHVLAAVGAGWMQLELAFARVPTNAATQAAATHPSSLSSCLAAQAPCG